MILNFYCRCRVKRKCCRHACTNFAKMGAYSVVFTHTVGKIRKHIVKVIEFWVRINIKFQNIK